MMGADSAPHLSPTTTIALPWRGGSPFVLAIPKPFPLNFFLLGHRPRYVNLPSFHVDNPGITHSYGILPSSGEAIGSLRKAASSSACRPVMSVLRVSGWLCSSETALNLLGE